MTQAQLARALQVQQNVVARLEGGGRADPRLSTVVAVAEALGVTIDSLVSAAGLTSATASASSTRSQLLEAARVAAIARQQLAELDETLAQLAGKKRPLKRR